VIDKCEVCGADRSQLMDLPEGTVYCKLHKGYAVEAPRTVEAFGAGGTTTGAQPEQPPAPRDEVAEPTPPAEGEPPSQPSAAVAANVPETPGVPKATKRRPRSKGAAQRAAGYVERTGEGPNVDALKLIIGLTLRAGLASLTDDNEPLEPPTGWLPPPASDVPEAEGGAALAVALLIRTFGIAHDDVIALALPFLESTTGEETPQ
jgi:hypothetical protein